LETIVEDRGVITPVAEGDFKTVLLITSKKGAKRANHYHKTDTHIMHIVSGKARYVETGGIHCGSFVVDRVVGPGDSIKTIPGIAHAMEFLEDTLMVVCSVNERNPEQYLNEIVPVQVL
jgi:quercetin dioxygenase-like cupin family protein